MSSAASRLSLWECERKLVRAIARDREAVFRPVNGQTPVVRGSAVRDVCLGPGGHERIAITGVRVRGRLDLSGAKLGRALCFRDCVFEDPVDLRRSCTEQRIEWHGGQLDAVMADQFESAADVLIKAAKVTGTVSLHWARIGGDLRFTDSCFLQSGCCAISAADLRVGRTLFLDGRGFRAEGEICLRSAHIQGDLDCRHAKFVNPSGYTIDAAHLLLDGELLWEAGFRSEGEACLQWAQVHRVRATGGTFISLAGYALHADAMRAASGIYLDRGFEATGAVRMIGANITGELCCTGGTFRNHSATAIDAQRIVADDVFLDHGFSAEGQVLFTDAQISRQFNATAGAFGTNASDGYALDADGLNCGGEVYLNDGFHARGAVSLKGAEIGGELNCTNGTFANAGGYAIFADGLTTPGIIYLDKKFRAQGEVRLARVNVGRQLVCSGGVFDNQHGTALDLGGLVTAGDVLLNGCPGGEGSFRATGKIIMRGAKITRDLNFTDGQLHGGEGLNARGVEVGGRLIWKPDPAPEGPVDLSAACISVLEDSAGSWRPGCYTLDGAAFSMPAKGAMTVDQRIVWLDHTTEYSATPYHEIAQSYSLSGDEAAAEKIRIAGQRHQRTRGDISRRSKAWNWFLGFTVGYGYRLHRVFVTLLVLGLVGWWLFHWGADADLIHLTQGTHPSASRRCPVGYPCFNPFIYSFQLLVPGLDLREATYWIPNATEHQPWGGLLLAYAWIMIVVGWIAATAVAAGLTRLFRRR